MSFSSIALVISGTLPAGFDRADQLHRKYAGAVDFILARQRVLVEDGDAELVAGAQPAGGISARGRFGTSRQRMTNDSSTNRIDTIRSIALVPLTRIARRNPRRAKAAGLIMLKKLMQHFWRPRAVPTRRFVLPPGRRVYAIGDIHGRLDKLGAMESEVARHLAENPPPIDSRASCSRRYIDRGPDLPRAVSSTG